jgi:hypothetical protein
LLACGSLPRAFLTAACLRRPIEGQHEVCGANRKTKDADWQATQGIYFEPADAPDRSEL